MLLLFLLLTCVSLIGFLVPISVNVLKHDQVMSYRSDVSLVQHVLRLLHHHPELLIVDLPFSHSSSSQSDLRLPISEFSYDCPKLDPKSSASPFPSFCSSFFPPRLCFESFLLQSRNSLSSCCLRFFPRFFLHKSSAVFGDLPPSLTAAPFHHQIVPIRVNHPSSFPFHPVLIIRSRILAQMDLCSLHSGFAWVRIFLIILSVILFLFLSNIFSL